MEAIRKIAHIYEDIIQFNELKRFRGKDVEVIVLPIENEAKGDKRFMDFAGKISNDEAQILITAVDDCRKIDIESWN